MLSRKAGSNRISRKPAQAVRSTCTDNCLSRFPVACSSALWQAGERKLAACGCRYCKSGETSLCDTTNESHDMKVLYGDDISGVHGYGHLTGGCALIARAVSFCCCITAYLHSRPIVSCLLNTVTLGMLLMALLKASRC